MKKRTTWVSVLALSFLGWISFQNCSNQGLDSSQAPFNSPGKGSLAAASESSGNGGSYDGKPTGEYIELDRLGTCGGDSAAVKSAITVLEDGTAFYTRKDCVDVNALPVATAEPMITADAPEILTVEGRLFEAKASVVTNSSRSLWACRTLQDLDNRRFAAITFLISRDLVSKKYRSQVNYVIKRTIDNQRLSVRRSNFIPMKRNYSEPVAVYRDFEYARGMIGLSIHTGVKQADLSFHFLKDPRWLVNTDTNPETQSADVLSVLGAVKANAIRCFGDELK